MGKEEVRKKVELMMEVLEEVVKDLMAAVKEADRLPERVVRELLPHGKLVKELSLPPFLLPESGVRVRGTLKVSRKRLSYLPSAVLRVEVEEGGKVVEKEEVGPYEFTAVFDLVFAFLAPLRPRGVLEAVKGLEAWAAEIHRLCRDAEEALARALEEEREALAELEARTAVRGLKEA